jgi:hypothetical protein
MAPLERPRTSRAFALCATVTLLSIAFADATHAQALSSDELQRRLEERDATIAELVRRVEALERKLAPSVEPARTAPPPVVAAPGDARAAANPAAVAVTAADEEQVNRALERALVREGGLVLPRGFYEVEPRLTYTHRATDALQVVTIDGIPQIARQNLQRDTLEAAVGLRVGLPWSSQLDLRIPYVYGHENTATAAVGESRDRSGLGDVEIGWTKQLATGRGGSYGLLGSLNYKTTSGSSNINDRLAPGSGFPSLQAALTAVKRQDPLVFYGSLSHTANLERTRSGISVNPSDITGLKVGTILAANPDTSLRFAFEVNRLGKTEIGGNAIAGSDTTVAMLEMGVALVLSPRSLLDFRAAIGLTPSSPNFRIGLALPIRFH